MPRTLPWLKNSAVESKKSTPRKRPQSPASSINVTSTSSKVLKQPKDRKRHGSRTPSTSPPPVISAPSPMRDSDRQWRMVEDELNATAKTFTQHLHFAEYRRLKEEAAHKSIEILRPTDGHSKLSKQSTIANRRQEAEARISKRLKGMRRKDAMEDETLEEGSDAGSSELIIRDKNLAGLMSEAGSLAIKTKADLSKLVSKSNTKASHGLKPTAAKPDEDLEATADEEDTDDLDLPQPKLPIRRSAKPTPVLPMSSKKAAVAGEFAAIVARMNRESHSSSSTQPRAPPKESARTVAPEAQPGPDDSDSDGISFVRKKKRTGLAEWRDQKQANR